MITAILVPIILIYFYYLTKKESKAFDEKWLKLAFVNEEAILTGKIVHIKEEKQRYYYSRSIHVLEIKLQTPIYTIMAKKITPSHIPVESPNIQKGDTVTLYGNWEEEIFQISRILPNSRKS